MLECVRVCYTITVRYSVLECVIVRVLATPVHKYFALGLGSVLCFLLFQLHSLFKMSDPRDRSRIHRLTLLFYFCIV